MWSAQGLPKCMFLQKGSSLKLKPVMLVQSEKFLSRAMTSRTAHMFRLPVIPRFFALWRFWQRARLQSMPGLLMVFFQIPAGQSQAFASVSMKHMGEKNRLKKPSAGCNVFLICKQICYDYCNLYKIFTTNEYRGLSMDAAGIFFWIIFALALAVFFLGVIYRLSIWLRGEEETAYGQAAKKLSRPAKFRKHFAAFLKRFFGPDFGLIIKSFFADGMVHVNLFKDSKLKWFIHIFMFWGLVAVFLITMFHAIAFFVAPGGVAVEGSSGFVQVFSTLENRFTALVMDLSKLAIMLGVVIAVLRFAAFRKKMKSVELKEKTAGILLAITMVFGFLYEACFILARSIPLDRAVFAPAGWVISVILDLIFPNVQWQAAAIVLLLIHLVMLLGFVAYIPYGKFSHMVFGPFIVTARKLREKAMGGHGPAPSFDNHRQRSEK